MVVEELEVQPSVLFRTPEYTLAMPLTLTSLLLILLLVVALWGVFQGSPGISWGGGPNLLSLLIVIILIVLLLKDGGIKLH